MKHQIKAKQKKNVEEKIDLYHKGWERVEKNLCLEKNSKLCSVAVS